MIAAEPDITRLLARLKRLKLVRQHRDRHDRRVVLNADHRIRAGTAARPWTRWSQRSPKNSSGHLRRADLAEMIRLLELARQACAGEAAKE